MTLHCGRIPNRVGKRFAHAEVNEFSLPERLITFTDNTLAKVALARFRASAMMVATPGTISAYATTRPSAI